MRMQLPWLCQGDIFAASPVVDVKLADGVVDVSMEIGPAVLLTHECGMDKVDKATGLSRVERLQFARLRSPSVLPRNLRDALASSRGNIGPFEVLAIGEIGPYGPSCILLTDPYYVPADFFAIALRDFADHPDRDPDNPIHAVPGANDTRIGRLDEQQTLLLRRKMIAFWTRLQEGDA